MAFSYSHLGFNLTSHTDIVDYLLVDNLINIPNGAVVGNTFCADVSLANDGVVEVIEEETFSISLTTPGVVFVVVPDTNLTVTIMDADGECFYHVDFSFCHLMIQTLVIF